MQYVFGVSFEITAVIGTKTTLAGNQNKMEIKLGSREDFCFLRMFVVFIDMVLRRNFYVQQFQGEI